MAQTAQLRVIDQAENEAQRVFALQREAYLAHPFPSLEERDMLYQCLPAGPGTLAILEAVLVDLEP